VASTVGTDGVKRFECLLLAFRLGKTIGEGGFHLRQSRSDCRTDLVGFECKLEINSPTVSLRGDAKREALAITPSAKGILQREMLMK